jgi:RNA 2',3'-cyclic 3'-phosphodiesterase
VRVFSALPLPPEAVAGIVSAFSGMRGLYPRLRWVGAQGFHITLHFFGEITEDRVNAVRRVLEDPELRRPPIPARLGSAGQFPPRGSPRVIWVGVEKGEREMRDYWRLFEEKIALSGFAADARGFTPHVTIARTGSTSIDSGWGAGIAVPAIDFLLGECILFQSVLGRGAVEYFSLKRILFEKGER